MITALCADYITREIIHSDVLLDFFIGRGAVTNVLLFWKPIPFQSELNITQRVINKKYENTRLNGRPRKRWVNGILEALGNITTEEVNRRAKDRNLYLPSTLRGN
jgi:hypothetical protein